MIAVSAASIVMPEMALAPLINGVCSVGGTLPISSKPSRLPSNSTHKAFTSGGVWEAVAAPMRKRESINWLLG